MAQAATTTQNIAITVVNNAQTPSSIAIGSNGCSGTSCSVPNIDNTFLTSVATGLPPNGTYVGTLSTTLSVGTPPFSGSYSLVAHVTGDNCGAGTIDTVIDATHTTHAQLSGDQLQYNGSATAGATYNVCVKATSGANSTTEEFSITVHNVVNASTTSGCTGNGSTGTPWQDLCIIAAVTAAATGDTVFLPAGNWALHTSAATPTGNTTSGGSHITSMSSVAGIAVGQYVGDLVRSPADEETVIQDPTTVTGINDAGCTPTPCVTLSQTATATRTGDTFSFGLGVIISKTINLVGAGSGNTFDAFGHPNNGCPVPLTAPTSVNQCPASGSQTVTRVFATGANAPNSNISLRCEDAGLGGFIRFSGINQTVSHIFFDGHSTTAGGGYCATLDFSVRAGPAASNGTANDVRVLNFNNSNGAVVQWGSEPQIAIEQVNGVTFMNSIVAQPIDVNNAALCTAASLQATTGIGQTIQNTYFYQSNYNPIAYDSVTFAGNVIFDSTDSFCTTAETPGTGPSGGGLGPGANAPANGTGSGNYHFAFANNYFNVAGQMFGTGGSVNDPNTNGGVSDLNYTGNWLVGQQVAIDSCVWHYYDPTGGWSGRNPSFPNYWSCAPTDVNGGGMQINATYQPWQSCTNGGPSTSDPPNKDNVTAGYGFNSTNNSLVATSRAQLVATGTGVANCNLVGGTTTAHTNTVVNYRASQNYLSSPGNLYVADATTHNPSVPGGSNFCAGGSTFAGSDSVTCQTTGFNTLPTVSFTLGNIHQVGSTYYVPITGSGIANQPTFTAQYGAVKWIVSTSPTTPTSGDARWSFTPPVSLSPVAHGNTIYLWVMDAGNHISAVASQVIP